MVAHPHVFPSFINGSIEDLAQKSPIKLYMKCQAIAINLITPSTINYGVCQATYVKQLNFLAFGVRTLISLEREKWSLVTFSWQLENKLNARIC